MNEKWPPQAPAISKDFKKAHDAPIEKTLPVEPSVIVTKKQVEALEKLEKKPLEQLNFTPPGMRANRNLSPARSERLSKMKERLKQNKGKARDDFDRSAENQL